MIIRTFSRRFAAAHPAAPAVIFALAALAVMSPALWGGAALATDEPLDEKALTTANPNALPHTYSVTVVLEDENETFEFSTVTATRHFSLAPTERRFRFRGRLRLQADGRELLEFSLELGQLVSQKGGGAAVSTEGSWSGSTYVESGRPVTIVKNPKSTITVKLSRT